MAIIGISGKKQSGKDTTCKIIQYFMMYPNSNGTTDGGSVNRSYNSFVMDLGMGLNPTWQRKLYADKLKDIVCLLINCTREQLEDNTFKETPLGEEWNIWMPYSTRLNIFFGNLFFTEQECIYEIKARHTIMVEDNVIARIRIMTPRLLLQLIGTECGRQIIHPNIWVNALMSEYKPISDIRTSNSYTDDRLNHGYNKTKIWRTYYNIKQRCYNINHPRYADYGGKGITMSDEWLNSIDSFIKWAYDNGYNDSLTIDRKENSLIYSAENCRCVSYATQAINQGIRKDNTSGYKGVSKEKDKWRASIQTNGIRKFLGYFNTAEEASEVYEQAFLEREGLYEQQEKTNLIYPNWCITDVRFPNEAQAIKDRGGIIIRINKPSIVSTDTHASEISLDNYDGFDYTITNDGRIQELINKVELLLERSNLLK